MFRKKTSKKRLRLDWGIRKSPFTGGAEVLAGRWTGWNGSDGGTEIRGKVGRARRKFRAQLFGFVFTLFDIASI
ncbi:hypothetical protein [Sagittula sp. SSi028]|uniref:hypothetical protein n=1 Tax=Sagittula sp. SSi028 TaxID=3400636 RepID=UPI003AF79BA5